MLHALRLQLVGMAGEAVDVSVELPPELIAVLDALEERGIGVEAMTVGSHEFYMGYAIRRDTLLCLDMGHFHPTENIADKLSGTLNSARAAKLDLPEATITLVDSATAALALGLVVKATAEAAQAGKSHAEVVAVAEEAAEKTEAYVILETLTYLQKGGRIGKAQALIGGLLSVKPILTIKDGEILPYEKVRSRAKGIAKLKEIAAASAPYAELGVIHEADSEIVTELVETLSALTDKPVLLGKIGAVIGVHAGPDVVGIAFRRT